MALTMYMKVTGKNQGEIKGSCDQGGDKKDKILENLISTESNQPAKRNCTTRLPSMMR